MLRCVCSLFLLAVSACETPASEFCSRYEEYAAACLASEDDVYPFDSGADCEAAYEDDCGPNDQKILEAFIECAERDTECDGGDFASQDDELAFESCDTDLPDVSAACRAPMFNGLYSTVW